LIRAEKGWTAFSWGEYVAAFVTPEGPEMTSVEVVSRKAMETNVAAWNWEKPFLDQLSRRLESSGSIGGPRDETAVAGCPESAGGMPPRIDPFDLEINAKYRLSKETPLWSDVGPPDPRVTPKATRTLMGGSIITVFEKARKRGASSYRVASGYNVGWVNAADLVGQDLQTE